MKKFLKSSTLIFAYLIIATIIELTAVCVTCGKFYIRLPFIFLLIQFFFVVILFTLKSNKSRLILSSILLSIFAVVDLVFIVIFEMTETIFDFGMFNLRNDGMKILESVPINFVFFSVSALLISVFIVFGRRFSRTSLNPVYIKWSSIPFVFVILSLLTTTLYVNNKDFEEDVMDKLYRTSEASYCEYGIIGNFINELVKGSFFMDVKLGDEQELESFIYNESDIYYSNFNNNQEYNVITILVESLEWHGFVQDFNLFANGFNINYSNYEKNGVSYQSSEEVLRELYPNLYNFYDSSIVFTNFYSREKTDISENLSIVGSYPTNVYINYDFPENTMSSTLPNVLKILDEDISCNAFHNGSYTYYNRNKELISAGFDSFLATEQMKSLGMHDYSAEGERNLDADMIEVCADKMFPTDRRFYTYITSITMHGQYTYRNNLAKRGYYDKMAEFGIVPMSGDSFDAFNHNNFYYYAACVMEFDRALGVLNSELKSRNLDDNTIICLFGDHNTYYSSLSNYVKDINDTNHENYTNLFRVPCMIKTPNIEQVVTHINNSLVEELKTQIMTNLNIDENSAFDLANKQIQNRYNINSTSSGTQILVKKFTCTADIVPTLFDLCGINVFGNLYFGHSAFDLTTSVLYSRAYDVFITDSMFFVSLNNIKYIRKDNPILNNDPALSYADLKYYDQEDHLNSVETEAKILLKKLSVCNRIFYNNYWARKNINTPSKLNSVILKEKLHSINNI